MKLLRFIHLLFLTLFISSSSYSIDTNAVKYYPLKVGNYWVYRYFGYPTGGVYRFSERVIDTLITNGHKYYKVRTMYSNSWSPWDQFVRVDSGQGNIRVYVTSGSCPWLINEISRDSLSAQLGDSSVMNCQANYTSPYYRCVSDTSHDTTCGLYKPAKGFAFSNYHEYGGYKWFVQDIGLTRAFSQAELQSNWINLRGFIINGFVCGDTTLTGINIISSEVPDKFILYQNYPDPFNPVTKIRFDNPPSPRSPRESGERGDRGGFIQLVVYDVLGREITTLVNEELQPGTYEVEWDGTNFPSGIYYYRLTAGDYSQTKKMVLIK